MPDLRLRLLALAASLAAAFAPSAASAQSTHSQSLRIALKAAVDSADPHISYTPNRNVQVHVWEALVAQDDKLHPVPSLAESWHSIDPLTWEFDLRKGVVFSDGTPFTSEDVAFSIRRAQAVTNARNYVAAVRNITAIDTPAPDRVIIHTRAPTPLQPEYLATIAILSKHAATDATEADFNGGRAAVGTGPYRWISWTPSQKVVLEANSAWRGPAEPWKHVEFGVIPDDAARVSALLAGDVDVIDYVPASLYPRVQNSGQTRLVTGDSLFTYYFYMDSMSARIANATGDDGKPLPENPLRNPLVREAMTHAINRVALAARAMDGGATPIGQVAPAGFIGNDPSIPLPSYDPALSRKLLAQAGYPNGFHLTIHCTADRFAGDSSSCQAIGQELTAIGIHTAVEALPMAVYLRRSATIGPDHVPELSAELSMFASSTGLASEALTVLLRTPDRERGFGGWNRTLYSNPLLDAALDKVDTQFDPAAREQATRDAVRTAVNLYAFLPVFNLKSSYGLRSNLTMTPRGDQYTMATEIRPAQ
ncbi:MAG TPA: ABC transporter substrate-binding protein [Rhizomicrobium sp.]